MVKATHEEWQTAVAARDSNAMLIAESVVRGEAPWPNTVQQYIDAKAEMQRIEDELDARS